MRNRTWKRWLPALYVLGLIVLIYVLVFMPLPYFIDRPGTAEEIKPMINVKAGDSEEKGTFMLTTVSRSNANVAGYLAAKLDKNAEISRKPKEDPAEYNTQQVLYMTTSQSNAMVAAYHKAGIPYKIESQYIFIVGLSTDPAPKGDFKSQDKVLSIDGKPVKQLDVLRELLTAKKPGETVQVVLEREGKQLEQKVELVQLKDPTTGKTRAGLGVTIGEVRKVVSKDPGLQVDFAKTDIGGPSAGLMFTLEIYNRLTPGDLSKGHRIAGTGTMDMDGTVGPIGGVQFKIVAADREKAEVFFVPVDNYKDAKKKADAIGTSMKLVPVKTVDDALNYLKELDPKS